MGVDHPFDRSVFACVLCLQDSEGAITAIALNVHTPNLTTSIELDASKAMIVELQGESSDDENTDTQSPEPQYCVAFLCNTVLDWYINRLDKNYLV